METTAKRKERIVEMKNKCHESVVIKKSVREHEKIIKRKFPPPPFSHSFEEMKETEKIPKTMYEFCVEL